MTPREDIFEEVKIRARENLSDEDFFMGIHPCRLRFSNTGAYMGVVFKTYDSPSCLCSETAKAKYRVALALGVRYDWE